jgi:4-hydroxy-tetrahydrodipicolinate reductase
VVGAGNMGRRVAEALEADGGFEVVGMVGRSGAEELAAGRPEADVAIDFSAPGMLGSLVSWAKATGGAVVSGTTGLSEAQMASLAELGEQVPVVWSANYALGVAVLKRLVAEAASALPGWDVEVVETHHNRKADAPSGTALALVSAIDPEGARPRVYGREGQVGSRTKEEIGIHSLRGGTVAGTHEVHLFGTDEELCLTHRAGSANIFATGAVVAAKWALSAAPGLHDFDEVLFGGAR